MGLSFFIKRNARIYAALAIIPPDMLKVLSGSLKGRTIETLEGTGVTRPPLSRIRKAVIDTLRPYLEGAAVLDVFGGSGSYSIEAISNGAGSAAIIELSPAAAKIIAGNVRGLGIESQVEIVRGDAFREIPRLGKTGRHYGVVFVAPPQGRGMVEKTLAALLAAGVLDSGAVIACQFAAGEAGGLERGGLTEFKRKIHGGTELSFLSFASGE